MGAHILAREAGDIIGQAALGMKFGIRTDDPAAEPAPHLANAEGLKLAARAFDEDVARLSCCAS